jgi:cyclin G-associated kinase
LDDVPDPEHVPSNFSINLSIFIGDDDRNPSVQPPWLSASHGKEKNPKALFSSQLEFEENVDNFITKPVKNSESAKRPPPRPAPPKNSIIENIELVDSASSADEEPVYVPSDPPVAEFDFLRLNSVDEPKAPQAPPVKVKEPSFDLLGGFDSNFQDPYPDLIGSALNKPTETNIHASKSSGDLEDIFGSFSSNSVPTMAPNKSANNLNFMSAPQEPQKTSFDPFADLAPEFSSKPQQSAPQPAKNPFMGQQNLFTSSSSSSLPKSNASTPIHQQKSPSEPQRPDYSRSHFQEPQQQGQQKGGKPADIFGDILGSQGFSFGSKNQGPKSINEMRKVELAQTMDPEKLKVQEWVKFILFLI